MRSRIAAFRRRASGAEGREADADPLGHAPRTPLNRRTRGTPGGTVEPAAYRRTRLNRLLTKRPTEENCLDNSSRSCERQHRAITECELRASALREQLPRNLGRLLV